MHLYPEISRHLHHTPYQIFPGFHFFSFSSFIFIPYFCCNDLVSFATIISTGKLNGKTALIFLSHCIFAGNHIFHFLNFPIAIS